MGRKIKTLTNMMKLLFCVLAFLAGIHANNWPQPDSERCIEMAKTSPIGLHASSYVARTCNVHLTTWVPTCKEEIREEIRDIKKNLKENPALANWSTFKEAVKGNMLQCLKKLSEDSVPEESFCFDCLCKMQMHHLLAKDLVIQLQALHLC